MDRRDFLKIVLQIPLFSLMFPELSKLFSSEPPSKAKNNRVVVVRNENCFSSIDKINTELLSEMLDSGIRKLTNKDTAVASWKTLFSADDIIGIKVNCLAGRNLSSRPELAYLVAEGLKSAGVRENNVIIWDRTTRELSSAGYKINTSKTGVRCFGTDEPAVGYEEELSVNGSVASCVSKLMTSICTAIINIPVLKDHELSGVSLSLKNNFGAINNPNKYHDNNCNPYIADLNSLSHFRNKTRLVIIDGLLCQYNGGPAYFKKWNYPYKGIIMATNPVAADSVGLSVIEEIRAKHEFKSLAKSGRPAVHIAMAEQKNLGVADLKKLDLIRI